MRARTSLPALSPDQPTPVLVASPEHNDHAVRREIPEDPNWEWHDGQGGYQALAEKEAIAVVIRERDQPRRI